MVDNLIRASGALGQIRVFAGVTTNLVEEARQRHNTSPVATAALGRALTAAALMGMMLKTDQEVSLQFLGDGPLGAIFVTADEKGHVRGYVRHPEVDLELNAVNKLDVAKALGQGMLYVIKDLGLKEPYQGSVPLTTSEIGDDLTSYFTKSEQTPSAVGLGVLINPNLTVSTAGGFIIQLMPYAEEELVRKLELNISKLSGGVTSLIKQGKKLKDLLAALLDGIEYHITQEQEVCFQCRCNRDRLEQIIITLGADEAKDIVNKEGQLEVTCHFCNEKYLFTKSEVEKLFN